MARAVQDQAMPIMLGYVTHIVDPSEFWMRIGSEVDEKNFRHLEQMVCTEAPNLPPGDVNEIVEHTIVFVCCTGPSNSKQWKRAKVSRVDREGNSFDVWYIDYGNTEIVSANRVHGNVPDKIQRHPPTVYRCALAGIQPIARSWTTRGVKRFQKLVSRGPLKAVPLTYDHDTMKLRLNLYFPDESSPSVAHQMLEAMTGLPSEENVQEYLKDVISHTYEEVYGVSLEDSGLSGNDIMGEGTTEEAEDGTEDWAIGNEPPAVFSQDQTGDHRSGHTGNQNSTTDDAASVDEQLGPQKAQSDTQQMQGQETVSDAHTDPDQGQSEVPSLRGQTEAPDEGDHTTASPTSVVVPGFNLSQLQKEQGRLSAEELQKEQEEMQQLVRRARLQKDMIECHRDLEHLKLTSGQVQSWGKSDILFVYGNRSAQVSQDVRGPRAGQVMEDEGPYDRGDNTGHTGEASRMLLYSDDKGLQQHHEYIPEHMSSLARSSDAKKDMYEASYHEGQEMLPAYETSGPSTSHGKEPVHQEEEEENSLSLGPEAAASCSRQSWVLPPPPDPHPSWTAEEKEHIMQQYVREVLKAAVQADGVGVDTLCAYVQCLAPLDAEHCESEMMNVLEALLEEAVRSKGTQDLALQVFHSYCGELKGEMLLNLLRQVVEKFVKLPVGKMPGYSSNCVEVLILLLYQALDWPVLLQTVIRDFILSCLEKWIIFNKKGTQASLMHHQLEKVYLKCAEHLLPAAFTMLQVHDLERVIFIFDQMKEKVLESDVSYSVRSDLLTLLLKFPQPDGYNPEPFISNPVPNQPRQMDDAPPQASLHPSLRSPGSRGGHSVSTQERGCQTENVDSVFLQGELSISSMDSSMGSAETSVPALTRRKQVLMEHLNRQKREGHGDGCGPQPYSAYSSPSASSVHGPQSVPSQHHSQMAGDDQKNRTGLATAAASGASKDDSSIQNLGTWAAKGPYITGGTGHTSQSDTPLGHEDESHQRQYFIQAEHQGVDARNVGVESQQNSQEPSASFFQSAVVPLSQAGFRTDEDGSGDADAFSGTESNNRGDPMAGQVLSGRIFDVSEGILDQIDDGQESSDSYSGYWSGAEGHEFRAGQRHAASSYSNRPVHGIPAGAESSDEDDWNDDANKVSKHVISGNHVYGIPAGAESSDEDEWGYDPNKVSQHVSQNQRLSSYSEAVGLSKGMALKQKFKDEFPPLPARQAEHDTTPSKNPLTLGAIASDFVQKPKKREEKMAQVKLSAGATSGFSNEDIDVGEDDEAGSVPSDWESRTLTTSSDTGDYGATVGTATEMGGDDGSVGQDSQRDWLTEPSVKSRKHTVNASGDYRVSQYSPSYGNVSRGGSSAAEGGGHYTGDIAYSSSSPHTGNEDISQRSEDSPGGGEDSPGGGGGVPYERGDLARIPDQTTWAKRKKKKFKPLYPWSSVSPLGSKGGRRKMFCNNCDKEGHENADCPEPKRFVLF